MHPRGPRPLVVAPYSGVRCDFTDTENGIKVREASNLRTARRAVVGRPFTSAVRQSPSRVTRWVVV